MTIQNPNLRARLVELIDKPLGFFVLALLIVETFIGLVVGMSQWNEPYRFYGLLLGVGMFIYLTLAVALLVWFRVENLVFDQAHHLKRQRNQPFGSDRKQVKSLDTLRAEEPKAAAISGGTK